MAAIVNLYSSVRNTLEAGWNGQKATREKENDSAFKVYIYDEEYKKIQAWVSEYQNIETGGDLFGLWLDDTTAVVQLVLGPGQKCKRTSVSFFQDLDYLKHVGDLLTNEEGLCHIGEWHSHHTLGLTRPSGGDENTVWSNMGRYKLHRFFLFIATITGPNVGVKCFQFDTTNQPAATHQYSVRQWSHWNVPEGNFQLMKGGSPFRSKLRGKLEIGAEVPNPRRDLGFSKESRSKKSKETSKKAAQPSVSERQGNIVTSQAYKPIASDKQRTKPDPKAFQSRASHVKVGCKTKPNSSSMQKNQP